MTEYSQVYYSIYSSPIGELLLTSREGMLTRLWMALQQGKPAPSPDQEWRRDDGALRPAPSSSEPSLPVSYAPLIFHSA